ncbi:MAG: hypothetical protein KIH44_009805 [Octadecabacter sp.]|nr:hypothetical protein [Octadecabacter sp.]
MKRTALACTLMAISTASAADLLPVTADGLFTISRASTIDQTTFTALSQTSATCLSPCLSPMIVAPNVPILDELDVIEFLSDQAELGEGLLMDARLPADRALGFISASVNIPAAGYPAQKTGYYRGGMLVWSTSDLSTEAVTQ